MREMPQHYEWNDLEEGDGHFTILCNSPIVDDSVTNINILELFKQTTFIIFDKNQDDDDDDDDDDGESDGHICCKSTLLE